jgi:hypothetical protein
VSRIHQAAITVDPAAIGRPGEKERLRGAELAIGDGIGALLGLRQFVSPAGTAQRHGKAV